MSSGAAPGCHQPCAYQPNRVQRLRAAAVYGLGACAPVIQVVPLPLATSTGGQQRAQGQDHAAQARRAGAPPALTAPLQ